MPGKKAKSKSDRTLQMVHPNAAAIDVGATLLMAAVRTDRTPDPVRSFGTFTTDLHRLVDWFAECGVDTVAMESTSVYWIPIYELLKVPWLRRVPCQCARCQARARTQNRRQRCTVAAAASFLRSAARQLSPQRSFHRVARLRTSARASARVCGLAYSAHAEGADRDEPPAPPCRRRHHRRNWLADHSVDPLRRA